MQENVMRVLDKMHNIVGPRRTEGLRRLVEMNKVLERDKEGAQWEQDSIRIADVNLAKEHP